MSALVTNSLVKRFGGVLATDHVSLTVEPGELHAIKLNYLGTVYDKTLIEGDTNGDGLADFQIQLKGLFNLTKADFVL